MRDFARDWQAQGRSAGACVARTRAQAAPEPLENFGSAEAPMKMFRAVVVWGAWARLTTVELRVRA